MRSVRLCLALLGLVCLLAAPSASGVTTAPYVKDPERIDAVTSSAALRAQADVQIRRIRSLVASKSSFDGHDAEHLARLQRQLRGQK